MAHVLGGAVLANAVVNIMGNTKNVEYAIGETKRQMSGFMVFANTFGGRVGGSIANMLGVTHLGGGGGGIGQVAGAMRLAERNFKTDMNKWFRDRPFRGSNRFKGKGGPLRYHKAMANWQIARPEWENYMRKHVHGVAKESGMMSLKLGIAFGAMELLGIGLVSAAKHASEFVEQLNKTVKTFGEGTPTILAAANAAAKLGVSRTQFLRGASTMGVELLGSGLGERKSTRLTKELTDRAVDVASLYDISVEDVMHKFVSGLAGFGRPLKELGVIINEDRVKVEALSSGLWDGKHALSEDIEMQARANLILRETARAEGDRIDTASGYANQLRALSGNWDNLMTSFGNSSFMATGAAATNGLIGLIQGVTNLPRSIDNTFFNNPFMSGTAFGSQDQRDAFNQELAEGQAHNFNMEQESRAYADRVMASRELHKDQGVGHSGLVEFSKKLQEGVFHADYQKQQLDLTKTLVNLTKEQVAYMKKLGFTKFVDTADMTAVF